MEFIPCGGGGGIVLLSSERDILRQGGINNTETQTVGQSN